MWNCSEQFFVRAISGELFYLFCAFLRLYHCSQRIYSISRITPRQCPLRSPIKTIIIWLTKQIMIQKKIGTFLGKYPWWSPVLTKSQGHITEAGLRHWNFFNIFNLFWKTQSVEYTELSSSDLEILPYYLIQKLCCTVFQNLLQTGIRNNSYSGNYQEKRP